MSDSSIAENGKEFSEMQKVTLLLHRMEHSVFPDAKLTREIKLKTIEYAKDIVGLVMRIVKTLFRKPTTGLFWRI